MKNYIHLLEEDILRYEEFLKHMYQLNDEYLSNDSFVHIRDIVKQIVESIN